MRPAPVLVFLIIEINQLLEESSSKGLLDQRVAEIDSGLKAKIVFVGLKKRLRDCSCPFKTVQAFPSPTAISPRATAIWGGSTRLVQSLSGCVPSVR